MSKKKGVDKLMSTPFRIQIKQLDQAEIQHGISNFHEPGNICSINIIARSAVFLCSLNTGFVDACVCICFRRESLP